MILGGTSGGRRTLCRASGDMTVRSLLPGYWEQLEQALSARFGGGGLDGRGGGSIITSATEVLLRRVPRGQSDSGEGGRSVCFAGDGSVAAASSLRLTCSAGGGNVAADIDGGAVGDGSGDGSSLASFNRRLDEARLLVASKQQQVRWG